MADRMEINCRQCKKLTNNNKFCSQKCAHKYFKKHKIGAFYNTKIQRANSYKRKRISKIIKKCLICKKIFKVYQSGNLAKYCSLKCQHLGLIKPKIIKYCKNCNNRFEVYPCAKLAKFCSRKCNTFYFHKNKLGWFKQTGGGRFRGKTYNEIYGIERSKLIRAQQSANCHLKKNKGKTYEEIYGPNKAKKYKIKISAVGQNIKVKDWDHFTGRDPYDQKFDNIFKNNIRKRDNQKCILCKINVRKLKSKLCVHHIDHDRLNTSFKNCCALCRRCNARVNKNSKYWTNYFQKLLTKKYGYKYIKKDSKRQY